MNGLLTNTELIDTIIADCNSAIKALASGQYILWCGYMAGIAQKLSNLKNGITNDMKNREETIEALKEQLRRCGSTVEDMKPDEFIEKFGGAENGSN